MFQTWGIIKYGENSCRAWLDDEIGKYYRSLLPKAWGVQPPMHTTHVSIVRVFEKPNRLYWKKYEGSTIEVIYYPSMQTNGLYFWLNCMSDDIERIRKEMGLSIFRSTFSTHHITVGNLKN